MKILNLSIKNFKAIEFLELKDLSNLIVIVGQNGVGKSCILDAIRLLKTSYGEYNTNEINNWFSEFEINLKQGFDFTNILRDINNPMLIEADFEISNDEIEFLKKEGENIIIKHHWNYYNKESGDPMLEFSTSWYDLNKKHGTKITEEAKKDLKDLENYLKSNVFNIKLEIKQGERPKTYENTLANILFSNFMPENLGVIDYHGAHRSYQKEGLRQFNVNFESNSELQKNHSLYNYVAKYNNIKTEMASQFIKALISKEAGKPIESISNLNESLKKLFETFFPGKYFEGMKPNKLGSVDFPVKLSTGEEHDINDLSSGEKEILFGYIRLRNSSPKNSIIIIDEPELHLNPKIAKKLPAFYEQTIGSNLNNQIWLVSHSEAILKESVHQKEFSVFYLNRALNDGNNQIKRLSSDSQLEAELVDLIGTNDISNIVVVLEGEDSEFDKELIEKLFPEFEYCTNSISAGSSNYVAKVNTILETAYDNGILNKRFASIRDKDSGIELFDKEKLNFTWDSYHIENYLLNEKYILMALTDLGIKNESVNSIEKIEIELLKIVKEVTDNFHLKYEMNKYIKDQIYSQIKIKGKDDYLKEMSTSIKTSLKKLSLKIDKDLNEENLNIINQKNKSKFESSFTNSSWKKIINGRMVLKAFSGKFCNSMNYLQFRNIIISSMVRDKHQPAGMKKVIDEILKH